MTQIQANGFNVAVIRSKRRKTLALAVANGEVTVRMPHKMALHHAEKFIQAKTAWINDTLAKYPALPPKQFINGEQFLFQGQLLTLVIKTNSPQNSVKIEDKNLFIQLKNDTVTETQVQKRLIDWYKQQANQYLISRCQKIAASTGLMPKQIIVKTYKARWGSCTRSGDIQFNWKLVMAPMAVIDYVIVHELCHLKQHNHSPAFWQLVKNFCPNYQVDRAWLKSYGQQLSM
jgi:hypothetical protein